jgi:hypothetical protein
MRVLLACLIVLGAFSGTAIGFAVWGAGQVRAQVETDTSCMLLDAAENDGLLSRSERLDVIRRVAASAKLAQPVRAAAGRLRTGCPKQPPATSSQREVP